MFDRAARLYIFSILSEHSAHRERTCAKEPLILIHMAYLSSLFPRAKFVYMVRDPRAVAVSSLRHYEKKLTSENKKWLLNHWNVYNMRVGGQCERLGKEKCMMVYYEKLVLNFNRTMSRVCRFLDIGWTDDFLRHEAFVGGRVKVSEVEWSTRQIKRPLYADSLTAWTKETSFEDVNVEAFANMTTKFGYDMNSKDYNYFIEL
jgi:hypothetical protein